MKDKDKIELLNKSLGKFIIINDYAQTNSVRKRIISGIIETNVDLETRDIAIRNIKINEIRCIGIDSFSDFVIKEPFKKKR